MVRLAQIAKCRALVAILLAFTMPRCSAQTSNNLKASADAVWLRTVRESFWLRSLIEVSPEQQGAVLANDKEFGSLSPLFQRWLRNRLRYFSELSPAERDLGLRRMEEWENLTDFQKKRRSLVY